LIVTHDCQSPTSDCVFEPPAMAQMMKPHSTTDANKDVTQLHRKTYDYLSTPRQSHTCV